MTQFVYLMGLQDIWFKDEFINSMIILKKKYMFTEKLLVAD